MMRWAGTFCSAGWLLLGLAVVLVGCEQRQPESPPETFRYHLPSVPTSLDPATARDPQALAVIDHLFAGLMRRGRLAADLAGGISEPELAQSYSVSADGLRYEFQLRPNAHFHNGRQIEAADFKISWERLLAPETASPHGWLLEPIKGAEAFRRGAATTVTGIEVEDPRLLRIRLTKPFAPFLDHLANPAASVVPHEEIEHLGKNFSRQPIGSGPYRFVEWINESRLHLAAFDGYPQTQASPEHLTFEVIPNEKEALRQFQAGRLDLLTRLPAGSQEKLPVGLRLSPGLGWYGFCFRCDQEPFDDPRVRRAFAQAVDRLLDAAREASDATKRIALYRRAEELILNDAPCVALFHDTKTVLLSNRWRTVPLDSMHRDLAKEPVTFHYHLPAAPTTLDPAWANDSISSGLIDRLFDGLMRMDRVRNVPEPELAQSYTISEDGRVYDFRLLPEARFHNGRPVRASDVKYSWERVLAAPVDSPNAWLFEMIVGVDAFRAGEAESVSGIEARDPHVLRVHLKAPFAAFLYNLTVPAASVVPQEEVRRWGENFEHQPVGSGPFRFQGWDRGQVIFAAFDDHARHPPRVRRLIYQVAENDEALRRYEVGELDLVSHIPMGSLGLLRRSYSADLRLFPSLIWSGFCFRCDRDPFDDPRVRRAFSLVIDRDSVVKKLGKLQRTASTGFVPQGIPGHNPETLTKGYDLKRARALFAEAGYNRRGPFPAQIYHSYTGESVERRVKLLIAEFSKLGAEVDHRALDFSVLLKAKMEGSSGTLLV